MAERVVSIFDTKVAALKARIELAELLTSPPAVRSAMDELHRLQDELARLRRKQTRARKETA